MNEKNLLNLKQIMEESLHFKDLKYTKSKKLLLRKVYMQKLISKLFVILVSAFLFYLFVSYNDPIESLYVNNFVFLLIIVPVIIAVILIGIRLDEWISTLHFSALIKTITNCLIVLFFIYQLFTPYFYSTEHLEKTGVETIEAYYNLSNEEHSKEERQKITESILTETLAFSTLNLESFPKAELVNIRTINTRRNYYLYYLTVEIKQLIDQNTERRTYQFEFVDEAGTFKIDGIQLLINN